MLEPDRGLLPVGRILEPDDEDLFLDFVSKALPQALHIFRTVHIQKLNCRCVRTQSQPFIEFTYDAFHLNQLHSARIVHIRNLVVLIHAKVGAGNDLSDTQKVETFESNGCDFLLIIHIVELIETFTLVINLDPSVVREVGENLILGLQAELITELAARFRAQNVMLSLFTRCRLKRALNVVKNAETIQSAALKVAVVVVGHADNLLSCLHLFDDRVVGSVKNLNVSQVERH